MKMTAEAFRELVGVLLMAMHGVTRTAAPAAWVVVG